MTPAIRVARPGELPALDRLEDASDVVLFAALGATVPDGPWPDARPVMRVLVSGDPAVGFALLTEVDGQAHLQTLAVHPDHMRRGTGRALLREAVAWAAQQHYARVTLTTFRDVAFNAPFYASEGFVVVDEPAPELARIREQEHVLDALAPRVAMARAVP